MPSIGFLSKEKRNQAFLLTAATAQELVDRQQVDTDTALAALTLLHNNHKPFYKACAMAAMNASRFSAGMFPFGVGETFIQQVCSANECKGFRGTHKPKRREKSIKTA